MRFPRALAFLTSVVLLGTSLALAASAALPPRARLLLDRADAWPRGSVVGVGQVRTGAGALESAADILALYYDAGEDLTFRVSLVAPVGIHDRVDHFTRERVRAVLLLDEGRGRHADLPAPLRGPAPFAWDRMVVLEAGDDVPARLAASPRDAGAPLEAGRAAFHLEKGWLAASLPRGEAAPRRAAVLTLAHGRELDRLVVTLGARQTAAYEANVAFMHFGNQGLGYSDVFHGRSGAEGSSGFDEILRVHQDRNIPVNVHLSGLLQSSAEWDARNGDPVDFNAWMRAGVTAGWLGVISSAYGQPILPFLQAAMNGWAVDRQVAMDTWRYGYTPHVAWVPERVWLTPGQYPGNGVIDWSGSWWQANGIEAVILDDWPHCSGHDNHQIHTISGSGLRIIPRDGDFTGKLHGGDGAGALAILSGLAGSGLGTYRLVTYADDWEMAAALGNWAADFPYAYGTYLWMIDKCATESAWLHTWKLDPALGNPDFNGDTFTPVNGTYPTIGGTDGYGGSNNAWYGHWAGYVPYSTGGDGNGNCAGTGGNCKNHGTLWNDAHAALQAAPDNGIREAGWYVLMTNLHETGWHDYLGGPISGWQRKYSAHIKNANVYAEAARWAGGLYANPTGAFFGDLDNDGFNELAMYNDRVLAVFESIGGRACWVFAKSGGGSYSVVGIDNAYWYGTEGDYNDGNHVGALSDVGPDRQHDFYAMSVDTSSGSTVQATFTASGVKKTVRLTLGQPWLDVVYRVGANTQYVQSGWSPDLVDLLYNAEMDRVWAPDISYMGRRNPNTAATGAWVLGGGGAQFQKEVGGTLMKADEIHGTQKFEILLYAGPTSPPDGSGHTPELQALAAALGDRLPPEAVSGTYFPATCQLTLTFDEPVRYDQVTLTGIAIDADDDGAADATLDAGCSVLNGANSATLTILVSNAVHAAIQGMSHTGMLLLLQAGAVVDVADNGCAPLTNAGDVPVSYGPPTLVTLDGYFNPAEWPACAVAVADSGDSGWNPAANEIVALGCQWDDTYLYLGIRGIATANSWLLYLDTDPYGANGFTNLTAIDHWERGATFTATGFKPDWQFGAYQHQGVHDGQSFWKLLSATTSADSSSAILAAFDPMHLNGLSGGSEIAIPWNTLYGLGAGRVPANCRIGFVASLAWDPEPDGVLGGDQAPNNLSATPPVLDNFKLVSVDADGDGVPDPTDRTAPTLAAAAYSGWDSLVTLQFSEPVTAATANQPSRYAVYQTGNPSVSLTVRGATRQGDPHYVRLLVSPMSHVGYTVVASGVADTSCFRNASPQTSTTFQGPPVAVDPAAPPAGALALAHPAPNPTRVGALLAYALPGPDGPAPVALELYDLGGRLVRTLVRASQPAGQYQVTWDGRDDHGRRLASGVYFVRLSLGARQQVKRLVILP
jgi:hypothetical protein